MPGILNLEVVTQTIGLRVLVFACRRLVPILARLPQRFLPRLVIRASSVGLRRGRLVVCVWGYPTWRSGEIPGAAAVIDITKLNKES